MKKKLAVFIVMLFFTLSFGAFFQPTQADGCQPVSTAEAPSIFQVDVTNTTAILHFTPVNDNVTGYTIFYGYIDGEDQYNATFSTGASTGALTYTINELAPGRKYHFRVLPKNDCSQGVYSEYKFATTTPDQLLSSGPQDYLLYITSAAAFLLIAGFILVPKKYLHA